MIKEEIEQLYEALKSYDAVIVRKAVAAVGNRVGDFDPRQVPEVVEMLASLFYIDTGDRPDFFPVIEDAVKVIASIGEPGVPTLMWLMNESDYKANLMLARTLGRIGPPAYGPVKDLFYFPQLPWHRALAMFAMAKMNEAALMEIFPDTVNALGDSDREIRDTAARTVGRIIDSFKPGQIPHDLVREAFEKLLVRLKDTCAVVRSKSVRSIGKMVKNNYLTKEQLSTAREEVEELLGLGSGDPDPFYLVRKEAEETMSYLETVQGR